jgi:penicillin-binding protein 1C
MKKHLKKLTRALFKDTPLTRFLHIVSGSVLIVFSLVVLWIVFTPIPSLDTLNTRKIAQSTKIYDRTGETVLFDLNSDVRRNLVPLEDISKNLQLATIAIEDDQFYSHSGFRPLSFLRAVLVNLRIIPGIIGQGGSTITQQTVKLTLLTGEKSIARKLHELILAFKLEDVYTKDEILELYLNNTPYGGTLYGAEAASRAFFGKSAETLTVAESAYLAALPQSPTFLSPYGNNKERLESRKNLVLERMYKLSYITQEQYDTAKQEKVAFSPVQNGSIIAPHFVFYVREYLEEKYGPDVIEEGLFVTTTLDTNLQNKAQELVSYYAKINEEKFNASNAALLALDPKTGEILSMVGSRNYFDKDIDGAYNATLALRQPGSSFKPIVYAAALENGFSPFTPVGDYPTQFSVACNAADVYNSTPPCYAPQNYDGQFRGDMTFITALAQSRNIPAIKALYYAGINDTLDLAERLGITTLRNVSDYGLSLALGAGEVPLLDMVNAYSVFAADGVYHTPLSILKVETTKGEVLEDNTSESNQVVAESVARDMNFMLSNNEARFPEYSTNNPFFFPGYDVAAKTGTTNDYRDVWTVGYTSTIAVGVWAGNNDNSPMEKKTAGFIISPLWHDFMAYSLPIMPKEYFGERLSSFTPSLPPQETPSDNDEENTSEELPPSSNTPQLTSEQRQAERRWRVGERLFKKEDLSTTTDVTSQSDEEVQYTIEEGIPL